jgi:hypothetical protein
LHGVCQWRVVTLKVGWIGFIPPFLVVLVYFAYFLFPGVWLWLVHDNDTLWMNAGNQPGYLVNTAFFLGAVSIASFGLGSLSKLAFPGKADRFILGF